jgi:hypothetical protein
MRRASATIVIWPWAMPSPSRSALGEALRLRASDGCRLRGVPLGRSCRPGLRRLPFSVLSVSAPVPKFCDGPLDGRRATAGARAADRSPCERLSILLRSSLPGAALRAPWLDPSTLSGLSLPRWKLALCFSGCDSKTGLAYVSYFGWYADVCDLRWSTISTGGSALNACLEQGMTAAPQHRFSNWLVRIRSRNDAGCT